MQHLWYAKKVLMHISNLDYQLNNKNNVFVSVGANDLDRVKALSEAGATNYLLDIANGYIQNLNVFALRLLLFVLHQ